MNEGARCITLCDTTATTENLCVSIKYEARLIRAVMGYLSVRGGRGKEGAGEVSSYQAHGLQSSHTHLEIPLHTGRIKHGKANHTRAKIPRNLKLLSARQKLPAAPPQCPHDCSIQDHDYTPTPLTSSRQKHTWHHPQHLQQPSARLHLPLPRPSHSRRSQPSLTRQHHQHRHFQQTVLSRHPPPHPGEQEATTAALSGGAQRQQRRQPRTWRQTRSSRRGSCLDEVGRNSAL